MKLLLSNPILIYTGATVACLVIMLVVDYFLGAEAEHLNAWVIVNRLFGNQNIVGDSLALSYFGLAGATLLMLVVNAIFGVLLVHIVKFIVQLIHF